MNNNLSLLRALAAAQGVTVQEVRAEIVRRYAEAYALEVIGPEGIEKVRNPEPTPEERQRQAERAAREAKRAEMRRRRAGGESVAEIAAALGIHRTAVTKATSTGRADAETVQVVRRMLDEGRKPREIVGIVQRHGDNRNADKLRELVRRVRATLAPEPNRPTPAQAGRQG